MLHTGDAQGTGIGESACHGVHALVMGERRDGFVEQVLSGVFERAGGIALGIANDGTAGWVGSLCSNARGTQRGRVGETHVAVVTTDKDGRVVRDGIDQLFGRELRGSPLGFIPVTAENPRTLGRDFGAGVDAADELLGAGRVVELDVIELHATGDEVHMGIVEAGEEEFASGVEHLRFGTTPGRDFRVRAYCDDAVTQDGDRLRGRFRGIDGPDVSVDDDEVGSGWRLGFRAAERQDQTAG